MTSKKPRRGRGEGSIYQRKDGRYTASMPVEGQGRKRKYFYGKTRSEVREKLHTAQLEQRQGILATGPKQTVKDYLDDWLENIQKAKLKVSTYSLYRRHLDNHIIPGLGHIQLQKLTADQVQAFYSQKQKEGIAASTIRAFHVILGVALKDAVRRKRLPVNICTIVTPPRRATHEIQPLTAEQARHLLEAARESRLLCLLTLALATGMRLGEILALRWEEVDLEKGTLQVRHTVAYIYKHGLIESEPKSESSRRSITLPQFVIAEMEQHRIHQAQARKKMGSTWEEHGLVFPNKYGRHFNRASLQNLFKKALRKAGLPDIRFHDLRHSAATILLSMGVPAKVVQELLGHSHISITLSIYAHVLPGMHKEAMSTMDGLFGDHSDTSNEYRVDISDKSPLTSLVGIGEQLRSTHNGQYTEMKIRPAFAGSAERQVEALDRALSSLGAYVFQIGESGNPMYKPDEQGQYTIHMFETDTLKILRTQALITKSDFIVVSQEIKG